MFWAETSRVRATDKYNAMVSLYLAGSLIGKDKEETIRSAKTLQDLSETSSEYFPFAFSLEPKQKRWLLSSAPVLGSDPMDGLRRTGQNPVTSRC